ncbi:hypothetical protein Godav_026053 [Gossypium davidsonii]|uniref:Uncharacterized protein n=1 Tax=Gossypium davidsonii TaxID=34287 RepID=A0A7J8THY8_GOSDV|nr:hypothetical protein [Gossypium davidsonii]
MLLATSSYFQWVFICLYIYMNFIHEEFHSKPSKRLVNISFFSHPSVESVTKHFSNASQPLQETTDAPSETYRKERINLLLHGTEICHWWKAPIDQLNLREL